MNKMGMRAVVVWLTLTAFVLCPLSALGKKKRKRKKGPRKPDPAIALEDPSYPRLDAHCAEDDALAVLAAGEVSPYVFSPPPSCPFFSTTFHSSCTRLASLGSPTFFLLCAPLYACTLV